MVKYKIAAAVTISIANMKWVIPAPIKGKRPGCPKYTAVTAKERTIVIAEESFTTTFCSRSPFKKNTMMAANSGKPANKPGNII
jgi:hypothetical protein